MNDVNLVDNWYEFNHEILKSPTAGATIDEGNVVHVQVFVKARHWIGAASEVPFSPVTHSMGFMVHLKDMWVIAERAETPFKQCRGRKCGEEAGERLEAAMQLVNAQAENASIFYPAPTASEAYLQQELRKLHEIIEGKSQAHCAAVAIGEILKEDS